MNGLSPISKSRDKITLLTPNALQQMSTVCVIGDVVFIFFAYMMYMANEKILGMLIVLGVIAFFITLFSFSFKSNYVFDTVKKQISIEGIRFFVPFSQYICNFSDVAVIGVKCYEHKSKKRTNYGTSYRTNYITYYSYDLVYATNQQPSKFKKLATTMGINHTLTFEDINKMGELLSTTIECRFIKGSPNRSIEAFQGKYTMVEPQKSFWG